MKYIKKPVEIEAFQYDGDFMFQNRQYYVPDWAVKSYKDGVMYFENGELFIKTLEGTMHADVGDYIIKGVKGELYPCKPEIFEHMRVRLEMCEPDECDSCPMNDAYDMACEDDERFEEFE